MVVVGSQSFLLFVARFCWLVRLFGLSCRYPLEETFKRKPQRSFCYKPNVLEYSHNMQAALGVCTLPPIYKKPDVGVLVWTIVLSRDPQSCSRTTVFGGNHGGFQREADWKPVTRR